MKKLHLILFATLPFCLLLMFPACGNDHAEDAHSAAEYDAGHDGKHKTQDELLTLFEEHDSPHGEASVHGSPEVNHEAKEKSGDTEPTSVSADLEALLGGHSPVAAEPAIGAGHGIDAGHGGTKAESSETASGETHLLASETASSPHAGKLEDIVKELDASKHKLEEQIDSFKSIVEQRDDTINTLKRINQQLRDQISRLRRTKTESIENIPLNSDIQLLRDELLKLKNSFTLKVKEVDELREYNKGLLKKLDALDLNVMGVLPKLPVTGKIDPDESLPEKEEPNDETNVKEADLAVVAPTGISDKGIGLDLATSSLEFDAVVTAANGKIKEAFYTEFFLAKTTLSEILEVAGITLEQYKEVSSHAELWAQSRKYPFRYPDLQKEIRKALLDSVDDENNPGRRLRTDIDGNSGEIKSLVPGRYYVIGTASLGKVGVTWSVPVRVKSGHNKLSLTIANASWSL